VGPRGAVHREALKIAVAVAVPEGAVPVARQAGRAAGLGETVPRGRSVRAAPSDSSVTPE